MIACSNSVVAPGNGGACQTSIFSVEGTASNVNVYNLNTVGATQMVTRDGKSVALYSDNANVYPDTIAYYKSS
jgi:glucan 1,3-beta-glucosidase